MYTQQKRVHLKTNLLKLALKRERKFEKQLLYNSIRLATFLYDFSGVYLVLPLDAISVSSHFSTPVTQR